MIVGLSKSLCKRRL